MEEFSWQRQRRRKRQKKPKKVKRKSQRRRRKLKRRSNSHINGEYSLIQSYLSKTYNATFSFFFN